MKIENWDIDKVKPYDKNPRNNDDAVEATANSIREFGWQQPIVVDTDGIVIVGHTRLKAAKKLKLDQVPVTVAENLTESKVKAYRIADNKTSDYAVWDNKKLLEELDSLDTDIYTGFDESEIFDDVLDETNNEVLKENEAGVTHSLTFSTQNVEVFEEVKRFIESESDLDENA